MLQFTREDTLGVHVADFLDFESTLEAGSMSDDPSKYEELTHAIDGRTGNLCP